MRRVGARSRVSAVMRSCMVLVGCLVLSGSAAASEPPDVSAKAVALVDYASGRMVYQKNGYDVRPPASLTKIMSALLALESGQADVRVTVSARAHSTAGAAFNMAVGDRPPLWKLVYGMLLRSGNDAAVAAAEGVGGTEAAFVSMMNRRAVQLGLRSTVFANPHGLPASGHLSSARDMAVLARVALQNPQFAKVVSTREAYMTWNGKPRVVTNINKMLWRLAGADGVKTGYTDSAGYCLAASATVSRATGRGPLVSSYKPGERLVVVVLGCPTSEQRYRDAEALLAWGLQTGPAYTVRRGDTLSGIASKHGVSLSALVAANGLREADMVRAGQRLTIPAR